MYSENKKKPVWEKNSLQIVDQYIDESNFIQLFKDLRELFLPKLKKYFDLGKATFDY